MAVHAVKHLTKKGIVGVFCRTYSPERAIAEFLSDVYAPSSREGRYDYIKGTGFAGVQIYDDKFVYSHHGTDPAYGQLLNSFDLVLIHKFTEDDDSYQRMSVYASSLNEIKLALIKERQKAAKMEFADEDWQTHLKYTKGGTLES